MRRSRPVASLRWDVDGSGREALAVWVADDRSAAERTRDELTLLALLLARCQLERHGSVSRRLLARAADALRTGRSIGEPPPLPHEPGRRAVLAAYNLTAGVPALDVVVSGRRGDLRRAALALFRRAAAAPGRRPALAELAASIADDPSANVAHAVGRAVAELHRPRRPVTGQMIQTHQGRPRAHT